MLIGQMVNLLSDGQPLRMSKRAGTVITLERPGRRDRRGRRPLRAGALHLRHHHRHRPRPVGQAEQRQPGLLRAVRPRPARLDPAQRRRPRARARDRATPSTPRCSPTRRRASCCGRSPSSRGWSRPPRSCASRTGSRATSRTPPRRSTVLRRLPGAADGRRGAAPTCTRARLLLVEATRIVLANGLRPARRLRPRADVTCRAHEAGWAHADGALRGPSLAAAARRRQRAGAAAVVVDRPQGRRRRARGRRRRPARRWSPSTARRRTSSTRPTSGPGRGPSATRSPATTSTTPARRSCARRSRAGSPRRGSASTSAPAAS